MYYEKPEALQKMLELIGRCEDFLPKISELNDEISNLRVQTAVGDLVPFHKPKLTDDLFSGAMNEIQAVIDLKSTVNALIAIGDVERTYEIGNIVVANQSLRTKVRSLHNKEIDVSGYSEFGEGASFVILDIDGVNYSLYPYKNYADNIIFATREQLNVFFDKSDDNLNQNWFKVEFTLNGPDIKFAGDLHQVKLYEKGAHERKRNDWDYAYNHTNETRIINITADEVFGIMGTAYFKGQPKSNYLDIMFKFGDKFQTGFSQHKDNKEMYKYNGKISYFTKESGKNGRHYFPKDVFTGTQKERIASIVGIDQIMKFVEPIEEQNYAQG